MDYQAVKDKLKSLKESVLAIDDNLEIEIFNSGAGFYALRVTEGEYYPVVTIELSANELDHHVRLRFPVGSKRSQRYSGPNIKSIEQKFWKYIKSELKPEG